MEQRNVPTPEQQKKPAAHGRIFILGGNGTTLAFTTELDSQARQISASLVPLAWTPTGVVIGDLRQRVSVAADNIGGWLDQTFTPEDEHAFIAPLHDVELLMRTGWKAEAPETLTDETVVNPEDVPEDVLEGLSLPPATLVQCAICRRTCVRDQFVWNERQLCAWDYHATVFGRRGPWRNEPYEERYFETLPRAAYVAAPLLEEDGVETVLAVQRLDETAMRELVNVAITHGNGQPCLAVRTDEGLVVLRERGKGTP
ncbi:MAG TPA: hypothetical protein VME66_05670 [Candidatus Acidoferrales bacterium]|nr:hypothetical protein [Candidatus Acidoferrales bacterium]